MEQSDDAKVGGFNERLDYIEQIFIHYSFSYLGTIVGRYKICNLKLETSIKLFEKPD